MQANQKTVMWTIVVAVVVMIALGSFAVMKVNDSIKNIDIPETVSASDIAGLIILPDAPTIDTTKMDRVCELTKGCEFWEPRRHQKMGILMELNNDDAEDDFFDAMVDLTGIDEDYLIVQHKNNIDMKDYQIKAYSDDDKEYGNWEIKTFIKVRYYDEDEANAFDHEDAEYMYLVVTSVLDEGDYDSLSIEEVSRNFEFD